jgi:hypothetical protein
MSDMYKTQQNFGQKISRLDSSMSAGNIKSEIASPIKGSPKYNLSVKQIVESSMRMIPFGIEYYETPKVERAYLLKPHLGK